MTNALPTREELGEYDGASSMSLTDMAVQERSTNPEYDRYQNFRDYRNAYTKTLLDEFSFGVTRPLNTAVFGTYNAGKAFLDEGFDNPLEILKQSYGDAFNDIDSELDAAREEIGGVGGMSAALLAAFMPGNLGKRVDDAVDAGRGVFEMLAPGRYDDVIRSGKAAAAGGSTAALQGYFQGDMELEDVLTNGALGGFAGGLIQKIIGDNLGAVRGAAGDFVKDFVDNGLAVSENINVRDLAKLIDSGTLDVDNILTTQLGGAPVYRQWAKINDAIADAVFSTPNMRATNEKFEAMTSKYVKVQKHLSELAGDVHNSAYNDFRLALGDPSSRYSTLIENNQRLAPVREMMSMMEDTRPRPDGTLPLGAQKLSSMDINNEALKDLREAFKRNTNEELRSSLGDMYNTFNSYIRGVRQEQYGQDIRMRPINNDVIKNDKMDEIWPEITIADLLNARKNFAAELSPGMAFKNGTKPTDLKAGKVILKTLDRILGEKTLGASDIVRSDFARYMRVQDAFDMGQKFYTQRVGELKDVNDFTDGYGKYVTEYMDTIDDPLVLESFQSGFKKGMFDSSNKRGFLAELHNFLGPATEVDKSFFTGKGANYDLMSKLIGEQDTNTIVKLYKDGSYTEKYTNMLLDTFQKRNLDSGTPTEISEFSNQRLLANETDPRWHAKVVRSLIKKYRGDPKAKEKAEVAIELLVGGPSAANQLRMGIEEYAGGFPRSIGSRTGMVSSEMFGTGDNESVVTDLKSMLQKLGE